jgi:hypothetical protein
MAVPARVGTWVNTMPFSLNGSKLSSVDNVISSEVTLPFTETVTVLTEWRTRGVDPSGWRHRTEHPSFQRVIASGAGSQVASLTFDSFDLQATDISTGSGVSQTKVMLFRVSKFTSPGTTRVHNMKLWASDTSDFLEPQTHKILYRTSTEWPSGFLFDSDDLGNQDFWMPTSLPTLQNLFRTGRTEPLETLGAGHRTILGSGDADVSQWISIAIGASGTMPLGEYGDTKDGPDGFNIRVTYNVDNLADRFGD